MEYYFKNSITDKPKKLVLTDSGINLYLDDACYQYDYRDIVGVWLNKPGGIFDQKFFSCTLNIADRKPLFISSLNFDQDDELINQDNHYNSFIRVMHLHLKEKSKAKYHLGVPPLNYSLRIILAILVLAVCLAAYFHVDLSTVALGAVGFLVLATGVAGLQFGISKFPKFYNPDNIPLELLPR